MHPRTPDFGDTTDAAEAAVTLGTTPRGHIPSWIRRRVSADRTCAYCGVPWASQIEHVLPVYQGGLSELDNLVHACRRCNSAKGILTPDEWRRARLTAGLPWPPPNYFEAFISLAQQQSDESMDRVGAAFRADYQPMLTLWAEFNEHVCKRSSWSPDEWWARFQHVAAEFESEVAS